MQVIKNELVKEEVVIETFENGLTVIVVPKKDVQKKYAIWGTRYGSNDSEFVIPGDEKATVVPKGVAHFLEHKLFEQENGTNSLDTLTALGVNANAYTTNTHTAYLFECTENFYEALDELMDYVQNPYFTDENVEKEKGIIGQEIMMYDDYPEWRVYLNALEAMYHNHPIKLDITGTIETISHIDKDVLYNCYKTFYNPSNMVMAICGDFDPETLLGEVKKRLKETQKQGEIKRITPEEPASIVKNEVTEELDVSQPMFIIGIKDKAPVKYIEKQIAMNILLSILLGTSSKAYKELYADGTISGELGLDYESSYEYGHVLITGQSIDPHKVLEKLKEEIKYIKKNGIDKKDFERLKKVYYGMCIKEYGDVSLIARSFMANYLMGINNLDYLEKIQEIDIEYINEVFNETFKEENMVISIVKNK